MLEEEKQFLIKKIKEIINIFNVDNLSDYQHLLEIINLFFLYNETDTALWQELKNTISIIIKNIEKEKDLSTILILQSKMFNN